MAPRVGRMTPRRPSYGPPVNGDIPPSTLAAQIADRMVDGHHDCRDHDTVNFQLLLKELLEASDPASQPESNLANEAAVNSRLICVIVRAGLGKLRTGHNVDGQPAKELDAIRSLQAIDLIISRSPDTLFYPLDALDPSIAPGSPHFAWLLPRILSEIKEPKLNGTEGHVLAIIKRSVNFKGKTQTRCGRTSPITSTSDLLSLIECTPAASYGLSSSPRWRVPAVAIVEDLFPDHSADTDSAASCQITPRDEQHVFAILVLLLSGLLSGMEQSQDGSKLGRPFSSLEFVLSNLARTWAALSTNVSYAQLISGFCVEAIIRCLRNLLRHLVVAAATSPNISKASLLLYQIISYVLAGKVPAPNPLLESEVCQALYEIFSLAQQSTAIFQAHAEMLLPRLVKVVKAPDHFASLGQELQVGVRHAIRTVAMLKAASACRYVSASLR
ncbi:MAG: hypothetical protein Q9169_008419 [Polycauliona sp. 2 TL-2023]